MHVDVNLILGLGPDGKSSSLLFPLRETKPRFRKRDKVRFYTTKMLRKVISDKIFKKGPSKICKRRLFKQFNLLKQSVSIQIFKRLSFTSFVPFLNTLSYLFSCFLSQLFLNNYFKRWFDSPHPKLSFCFNGKYFSELLFYYSIILGLVLEIVNWVC